MRLFFKENGPLVTKKCSISRPRVEVGQNKGNLATGHQGAVPLFYRITRWFRPFVCPGPNSHAVAVGERSEPKPSAEKNSLIIHEIHEVRLPIFFIFNLEFSILGI